MNKEAREAIIHLMRGIFYKEENEKAFFDLEYGSFGAISDYFATIGLVVRLESADGYAYLQSAEIEEEEERLPKILQSRELSYKVSLLLVLLRKKIAYFEMQSEDEKPVVTQEELIESVALFLERSTNEVKLQREIEATIKKVEELGFLKPFKNQNRSYEIKSAIKAFVDAKWLDAFNKRLEEYKESRAWS